MNNANTFSGVMGNTFGALSGIANMANMTAGLGCALLSNGEKINSIGSIKLDTSVEEAQMTQKVQRVRNSVNYAKEIAAARAEAEALGIDVSAIFE